MSILKRIAASELPDSFFRPAPEDTTDDAVRSIIADVRSRGDDALRELAARFDSYSGASFKVDPERIASARANMEEAEPELANAYRSAASNIRAFANRQMSQFVDFELEPSSGLLLSQRVQPIDAAGLYIPGGRYPLISTLLMTAIPAQVAEVPKIVLCSPPRRGEGPDKDLPDERILAVAGMLGLSEVYSLGGAQAIAAMAIGTESVPRVDKVFGPGNRYVAAAKRMLYGEVGIDFIAGPTEVMVIADDSADPEWVAWDLLAQAEHDAAAIPVLLYLPEAPLEAIEAAMERILETLPTAATARAALAASGLAVACVDEAEAAAVANRKAPEHLELAMRYPEALQKELRNFGSLFVGHQAAEALGDFSAGINHSLPTAGAARYTGGLSVKDFVKLVTVFRAKQGSGYERAAKAAVLLAQAEGLAAHAGAAAARIKA